MPRIHPAAIAKLLGPVPQSLSAALAARGLTPTNASDAAILVTTGRVAIASAREFADAVPTAQEALIVILFAPEPPFNETVALQWAFTRQAALDLAARGIRVNAIGLGPDPLQPNRASRPAPAAIPGADIAATIALMWRLRSMTGQLVRLGPP